MKVLILSDAENTHTRRWVSSLAGKGLDIVLFSLSKPKDNFYDSFDNVKLVSVSDGPKKSLWGKLNYLRTINKLKSLIKTEKPDIIHAHYASSYGLLGALTKPTSTPFIISVWGSDVYAFPHTIPLGKRILKYNFNKADIVFSTSHIMAEETRKYTTKPIEVISFGVNVNLFKPQEDASHSDTFTIGCVKGLFPIYGIDTLIKATAIAIGNNPDKSIKLVIYGKGPALEAFKQLANDLNISEKVNFPGFINNNLLPRVYNSFSVAAFLSNAESFGVAAIEAMSCGCPVITSDADGFTEIIDDKQTGFIVPKQDPEAAARVMQQFIDNPSLRQTIGNNAREMVTQRYNWEKDVQKTVDVYNRIHK